MASFNTSFDNSFNSALHVWQFYVFDYSPTSLLKIILKIVLIIVLILVLIITNNLKERILLYYSNHKEQNWDPKPGVMHF